MEVMGELHASTLFLQERHRYALNIRLGVHSSMSGRPGEEKNITPAGIRNEDVQARNGPKI
jgi:hypothetical protein